MKGIENHNKNPSDAPCKRIQNYIYKYNDVLGKGNFSTVYKAVNTITNQSLAVKVIELNSLKSTKLKELLSYQIEILQKIDHPNIVKCFQVLTSINNCYIFTQLCQGGDLQSLLKKKGQFLQSELYELIKDIYQGLSYLAEKNIVHRDLKVSNIFLKNGKAKIADFGFAKQSKEKFDDVSIGSPLYMSPQGFLKNRYGPKTDVWSFGVLLYEITHGFTPYSHCKTEKQLSMMLSRQLKPSDIKSTLSDDFKELLLRCLDVNQEKRITFRQMQQLPFMKKLFEKSKTKIQKAYLQTTLQDKSKFNLEEKSQQRNKNLEVKKQSSIAQLIRKKEMQQASPRHTGIDLIDKNKPLASRQNSSKKQYKFITGNPNYGKSIERMSVEKPTWNSIRMSNRVSPIKKEQIRISKRDEQQKEKDSKKNDSESLIGSNYEKMRERISTSNNEPSQKTNLQTGSKPSVRNSHMSKYQFATRDPRGRLSESSEDNKYLRFNTSKSINKHPNLDLKYSHNINLKGQNEQKSQRRNPFLSSNNMPIGSGTITSSANLTLLTSKTQNNKNDENFNKNNLASTFRIDTQKQLQKTQGKEDANIFSNHSLFKPYLTEYCTKNKPQQQPHDQNRRQSMILNQYFLNNLNLPTEMQFLEAVGLLHYCRLFYKFISLINDYKQDNNSDNPFHCSQRYQLWIMGILGQIMDKIQSKSILYQRSKSSKEGKFKEVVKEYINKYTEYFLKHFPQTSKARLNNKISSYDIVCRLQLDWKKLEQYIQKSNKNTTYIVGGYYLMKLIQWTKRINTSQKDCKFNQFKGNEIENIINTKKSSITEDLYQSVKNALLQEIA